MAVGGHTPIGYYKDEEKSAKTFRIFEDRRWSVPGDWATVEADGSITLLGRGSQGSSQRTRGYDYDYDDEDAYTRDYYYD